MPMFTQCPDCRRWFHIEREQVETAHGLARCGDCKTVFNAAATLSEQPPPGVSPETLPAAVVEMEAEALSGPETVENRGEDAAPLSFEAPPRTHRVARWSWAVALVVAALVLAAQLVNANRYAIAREPVVGGALRAIYHGFGAPLGPRLNLARYAIADARLASPPGTSGRLSLDGRLINRAPFAQRLPLIELRLRNRRGDVIASRLLLPSDYAPTTIDTLAAGQDLRFRVELADPGAGATGFTLVLCRHGARAVSCRSS